MEGVPGGVFSSGLFGSVWSVAGAGEHDLGRDGVLGRMDGVPGGICSSGLFGDRWCRLESLSDTGELMVRLLNRPAGVGDLLRLNFRRLPDRAVSKGDPSRFDGVVGAKSFSRGITCQ
jgi:hypothetical protein